MANGDIAAAEAGFTAVKATDDFRLGYDRINEVADLAIKRGIRNFGSKAALDAVAGKFRYDLAAVNGDIIYWWNNNKWQPFFSGWRDYTPTTEGFNLGGGSPYGGNVYARYRWDNGMVRVRIRVSYGGGASANGEMRLGVPLPYYWGGFNTVSPLLDGQTIYTSNGRQWTGPVSVTDNGASNQRCVKVRPMCVVSNDTFAYITTIAQAQPVNPSIYDECYVDFCYEAADYPL